MPEFMTIPEAAAYLRVTKGQLATLRYTGKGPSFYAPTAKTVLYVKEGLDAWVQSAQRTGTSAFASAQNAATKSSSAA